MGDETVGQLLGRCLQAAGARRVFGSPSAGLGGVPGLGHIRVDEPALAALLADAQGWVGEGPGVALLPDRRLRLSADPGASVDPVRVDDATQLPGLLAGWFLGSTLGTLEVVLDIDLEAPAPAGLEPLTYAAAGRAMTLDPSLADLSLVVLAGTGVWRAGRADELRAFAARTGIGVVSTFGAAGLLPVSHPCHHGTVGLQARDFELAGVTDAAVVLAVGVDPVEAPPERWAMRQVLEVEPFQLETLAARWPESAEPRTKPALPLELELVLGPLTGSSAAPLSPARAAADLSTTRRGDGIVAADPGPAGLWVARALSTTVPGSVLVPARNVRGAAMAAAVAAALDERQAIAVTTGPLDQTTLALAELADHFGLSLVVCEWGADEAWSDALAHREALRAGLAAKGVAHVPVPVDLTQTRVLVEVAGEVVAWADR